MKSRTLKRYLKATAKGIDKQLIPWIIVSYVLTLASTVINLIYWYGAN